VIRVEKCFSQAEEKDISKRIRLKNVFHKHDKTTISPVKVAYISKKGTTLVRKVLYLFNGSS